MDEQERTVSFHRLARREYLSARRWYAGNGSVELAESFQEEVDRSVQTILNDPQALPTYENDFRWIRLRRFPYVPYCRILDDGNVVVLAVAHARRRPGYWRRRTV